MSTNARVLNLTDLPVLTLAGRRVHPNHAVTLIHGDRAAQARPRFGRLLQSCLLPGRPRVWISRERGTLLGLAAVQPRRGQAAWEIDALVLALRREAFVLDLLERCVATAGAHGAHRLFLRLPPESPAAEAARREGFLPVTQELLLDARGPVAGVAQGWRPRRRSDDHDLFRLYCRQVPQEVRWQTALSPGEWRAALDPLGRGGREWVRPGPDGQGLEALLRVHRGERSLHATVLGAEAAAAAQSAAALLAQDAAGRRLQILAPAYAGALLRSLNDCGFEERARYDLLVRPIAQRTRRLQLAERSVKGSPRPVIQ